MAKDGAYYLFTLRLVPIFPFFLINLGMGLTPQRAWTFFWVSLLGMLPGTFLYVNAGKTLAGIDAPGDILTPGVLVSLALLGIVSLAIRKLVQWRVRPRSIALALAALLVLVVVGVGVRTYFRYRTAEIMAIPVTEYSNAEYPEDPAARSLHFGQYNGRTLTLMQKDDTHFDFILEPTRPHVARVVFRDIEVSLLTPSLPAWAKEDAGLTRIALTDRQWNRQQVRSTRSRPMLKCPEATGSRRTCSTRGCCPLNWRRTASTRACGRCSYLRKTRTATRRLCSTTGSPSRWATIGGFSSGTRDCRTGSTGTIWSAGSTRPERRCRWTACAEW